jgi:hypothetical protein
VFGRTIFPYYADRIGSFNVVTMSAGMSGVCMLALWLPFNSRHSHAGLIVLALAYGLFSGALVSLLMPCVAKAGDIATLGRRFGTFQMVMALRYWFHSWLYADNSINRFIATSRDFPFWVRSCIDKAILIIRGCRFSAALALFLGRLFSSRLPIPLGRSKVHGKCSVIRSDLRDDD